MKWSLCSTVNRLTPQPSAFSECRQHCEEDCDDGTGSPLHPCSLPAESSPLEYSVYKPCLVLFGLVDHFQGRLKVK